MRTRTLIAIVVGATILLSGIVVLTVSAAQLLTTTVTNATTGPPLVEGEPGQPLAVDPLDCEGQCFTAASVGGATSRLQAFRDLGVPTIIDSWGSWESSDAATEYETVAFDWRRSDVEPEECFFTYFGTPVTADLGEDPKPNDLDLIEFTGTQGSADGDTTLWQSVRVFDTSDSAVAHMSALSKQTQRCGEYSGPEVPATSVTAAAAIAVPDSVAAIGWTESSMMSRYYVYDVQRGNLVVRSILSTWGGQASEEDFRSFVEELASDIGTLKQPAA